MKIEICAHLDTHLTTLSKMLRYIAADAIIFHHDNLIPSLTEAEKIARQGKANFMKAWLGTHLVSDQNDDIYIYGIQFMEQVKFECPRNLIHLARWVHDNKGVLGSNRPIRDFDFQINLLGRQNNYDPRIPILYSNNVYYHEGLHHHQFLHTDKDINDITEFCQYVRMLSEK